MFWVSENLGSLRYAVQAENNNKKHGLVNINPEFVHLSDSRTRGSQCLSQLQVTTDVYKYFYPCTISDWNRLPTSVTDLQTLQKFRKGLAHLPPTLYPLC